MKVIGVILMTMLTHSAYKGSKVLIALYALEFGAKPWMIGLLFTLYAVFSVLLSVVAGKASDRYGFRLPLLFGACGLLAALLVPFAYPRLEALFASAILAGVCYVFYTVPVQHLVGSFGEGALRTRNYGWYSLGIGATALLGPMTTGFAIDTFGHRNTYLLLAVFLLIPIAVLLFFARWIPRPKPVVAKPQGQRIQDLFRQGALTRVLITGGIVETGLELINFYMPIYAKTQGLTASQIGIVMGCYAVAMLIMRALLPVYTRHVGEVRLLMISLLTTAAVSMMIPLVAGFGPIAAMAFLLGVGLGCCSPLSLILVYNLSPDGRAGEAIGVRQSINKATETVMPMVFGVVATFTGAGVVFWMTGALIFAGSWIMWRDVRVTPKKES